MHRFFVDPMVIRGGKARITSTDDIKHISNVLCLRQGSLIELFDGTGFSYLAQIEDIKPECVQIRILDKQRSLAEPELKISLFQAILKHKKMTTIIQKSLELGIYEITPIWTQRTIPGKFDGIRRKAKPWQKISEEATKQCRRRVVPVIHPAVSLCQACLDFSRFDRVLFPYENEEKQSMKSVLRRVDDSPISVAFLIGPEGGFSTEEEIMIIEHGGIPVSLGKTTLQAETAVVVTLAMILYEWEL